MSDTPAFSSILVGTDGSATAYKAFEEATRLATELGAKLVIVSAFEPNSEQTHSESPQATQDSSWDVNAREPVLRLLDQTLAVAKEAGVNSVETFARQGDPADAILDVAEEQGVDLIVVGNKGMTGARRFLLGSVPNKISHHAPCSVLIVRTS